MTEVNLKQDITKIETKGELLPNLNLSKYNTWHVGGQVDYAYKPRDLADLQLFFKQLYIIDPEINITWLGLGSNVLIRDGGLSGVLILSNAGKNGGLNNLSLLEPGQVYVGAGVPCAKLAKFLADAKFPIGAFWAGIPGTMGGALAMNAGCYGYETWEFVKKVQVLTRKGELLDLYPEDFKISYRHLESKNNIGEFWFVNAWLELPEDTELCGRQEIKKLLNKRSSSQPIGLFSGGSVFKNPEGDYSARLIEQAGLKGYKIGGASISEKHANFIINDKTATAADIEQLILYVQAEVFNKFNIKLEPEVKLMGENK